MKSLALVCVLLQHMTRHSAYVSLLVELVGNQRWEEIFLFSYPVGGPVEKRHSPQTLRRLHAHRGLLTKGPGVCDVM